MSEQQGARPAGRGLKIALALSLAVNLAIVGLVIGAMIGGGPRGGDDPRLRAMGLGPFGAALSRADRADLAARMDRGALRDERRALGEGLGAFRSALTAEPFDRARAEAGLVRARAATETLQGIGHDALLDQIAAMSPAERRALAQRLDRALRRMGGHGPHR
jgi:uncharacterized membrane protein